MDQAPNSQLEAQDRALLAVPTRQSPVAVVFLILRFIRSLGIIQLGAAAAFIISGRVPASVLAAIPLVGSVILALMILSWWRHVFSLQADELIVAKGVLSQERLSIPLNRVQSVTVEQNLLNKVLGLVSLRVDTAGSDHPEFAIDAINRQRADAIQRLAAGGQKARSGTQLEQAWAGPVLAPDGSLVPKPTSSPPSANDEEVLVARTPGELVRIALARWPWAGLLVLAPLLAFGGELGGELVGDRFGSDFFIARAIRNAQGASEGFELTSAIVLLVIGAALSLLALGAILGMILQVTQVVTTDWNLQVVRTSTGLRRTAGLFNTTSKASTITRVQQLRLAQSVLEQRFGFARVSLTTIGDGDMTIPGSSPDEVARLRSEVLPEADLAVPDRMIDPAWIWYSLRIEIVVIVLLGSVAMFVIPPWPLLALLAIPLRWWALRRQWRLRRWGVSSDTIVDRQQFFSWESVEMELFRAQSVQLSRSFFERRRGLATVAIRAAEGKVEIPMIPVADARYLRDLALHSAESSSRRWM